MAAHNDGTVYARADISGLFKRNSDGSWKQLFDFLLPSESNLIGIEGVAIAPQNSNVVYVTAGQVSYDSKTSQNINGEVFKTTDGGATWEKAGLSKPFGADETGSMFGENIAVSPHDINTVYVLTRRDGLWKTEDGAVSWQKVEAFTPLADVTYGFVEFSKTDAHTVYVNIYGEGLYKTADDGASWELVPSSPAKLRRVAQKNDGTLIMSAEDGIYRYVNGAWQTVYQAEADGNGVRSGVNGIAIDPFNQNHILAVSAYGSDGSKGLGNNHILESYNGGASFTDRYSSHNNTDNHNYVNTSVFTSQLTSSSSIVFDGARRNVAYISEWFGIFEITNVTLSPMPIVRNSKGIDNTLSYTVKAMPGTYSVMAGYADIGAIQWKSYSAYAEKIKPDGSEIQDSTEFDYCEDNPLYVARVGASLKDGNGLKNACFEYSTDGGATWKRKALPSDMASGLTQKIYICPHVAVSSGLGSSGKPTILVSGNDGIYYSDDLGDTWTKSNGAPSIYHGLWIYNTPLVSDRKDNGTFYVCINNTMYISRDGGRNFSVCNVNVPDGQRYVQLAASPKDAGTLVLTTGYGTYITRDYGTTFTSIGDFAAPKKAAFGKGEFMPAIYVYDGDDTHVGIYASYDMGETWVKIKTPGQNFIGVTDMDASKTQAGLIYVATRYRGVFTVKVR